MRRRALVIAALSAFALGAGVYSLHSDSGARALARFVSSVASSPGMTVEIGAIDDALSSTPSIRDVVISDRDGPWLKIDRIGAKWTRLALLGLTLDIGRIDIGEADLLRRPAPAAEPPVKRTSAGLSFPPRLPIGVKIGRLALARLILAKPVAGSAATLSVDAGAELTGAAASVKFLAERLDAPGSIGADAAYLPTDGKLRLKFAAREPGDGLIARLAKIPGLPPVEASMDGAGTLDAFEARIAAKAGEADAEGGARLTREGSARRLDIDFAARLADLLPRDLAPLFAETTKIDATAYLADDGAKALDRLALSASAFQFDASGRLGPDGRGLGTARLAAADLGRFSHLVGRDLHGALDVSAELSGAPLVGAVAATLDGAVTGLGSGVPAVDGLVGERLALSGKVATLADGGLSFDKLALDGAHVSALVDGQATKEKAAIDAKIDLPQLKYTGLPPAGRAKVAARIAGALDKPDAAMTATLEDATANDRPIPKLTARGEAHDLLGQFSALATLDGVVDRKPARGRLSLARAGAGWKLDPIDLAVGSATAKGALALDEAGLASGRLTVAAPNLDDLSALALQKLSGRLNADVALNAADGVQNVFLDAQGAGIEAAGASIGRLGAKFSAGDLYRKPALDGDISIDNARIGQETIGKARLLAQPSGNGAAALNFSLNSRGFTLRAARR